MDWFNTYEYRVSRSKGVSGISDVVFQMWRISFFLFLCFTAVAPLATLAYLHGTERTLRYIGEWSSPTPFRSSRILWFRLPEPVGPSILSYLLGLGFYVTQIPERFIADKKLAHYLDSIGVGSHAIWHLFVVLGMSQYRTAIERMRNGIGCNIY